jgi:hypothetical protein
MGYYEEYLGRLKDMNVAFDDGKMRTGIEARITGRSRSRKKLVLEGVLAVLLIGAAFYFGFHYSSINSGDVLAE